MAEQGLSQNNALSEQEEKEAKISKLQGLLKGRLERKEELVPKEGKGKYNITVPVVFEFLERVKEKKTIREQKLEHMLKEAKDKQLEEINYRVTVNSVPRSTK
jgi:hypothetical protein